jgi:hypothetical protein
VRGAEARLPSLPPGKLENEDENEDEEEDEEENEGDEDERHHDALP